MSIIETLRNDKKAAQLAMAAGATIFLILFAFRDTIYNLFERWGAQEELSHSYFIPLISGWLIWSNREAITKSIGKPSMLGVYLSVLAAMMLLAGQLTHAFVIQQIGFVVAVAAIVAGFGGRSLLVISAIPILYLLFAVPPPFWAITSLSWNFQRISSELGVWMIQLMNIPVHLSGNIIDLGSYKLQVAEACSGLRYLFPFLSLGFLAAYLFKAPLWQRAIIFLSTIPITIFMNSFRIAVTGVLVQAYGTAHTEGFLHLFEGWVVFVLCLLALLAVISVFCLVVPPRRHVLDALGVPELTSKQPSNSTTFKWSKPIMFGAIAGIFAITYIASLFVTVDKLETPERRPFSLLPLEFKGWDYEIQPIDNEIAEIIGADDTIIVDMKSPDGDRFNVYTAYLTARRDGRSWHSPRQCIPGGGWQVTSLSVIDNGDAEGAVPFPYNRMVIEYRGSRQIVYYWYDQRGRKIANEYIMKLWLIYDTLTRNRGDGAMVRLMAPVDDNSSIEETDAKLRAMAIDLNKLLPAYIPE